MAAEAALVDANSPEVEAAFEAAPQEMIAEIIEGTLQLQPRPRSEHARSAYHLVGELRGPFDRGRGGPGGWVLLPEPELHLGGRPDKVVPDVAGWRRTRMPVMPHVAAITLAPDWVCEVLSPSTEAVDRTKKMRIYRRERVGHYWLIAPDLRTLEVYRLEANGYTLLDAFEGDVTVRAEPFEGMALDLSELWID